MGAAPCDGHCVPFQSCNAFHDPDLAAVLFQDLSLFNVKLQHSLYPVHPAGVQTVGRKPVCSHGVAKGNAVRVHRRQPLRQDSPTDGFAPDHSVSKPVALLLLKADHPHRHFRFIAFLTQSLHCLNGSQNPQASVKFPSLQDRIIVGAGHHRCLSRFPTSGRRPLSDQVARSVSLHVQPCLFHIAADQLLCAFVLRGEREAGDAAVRPASNPSQLHNVIPQSLCIDLHKPSIRYIVGFQQTFPKLDTIISWLAFPVNLKIFHRISGRM